jgi:drug/metabolite transporter (DMT)-like permease
VLYALYILINSRIKTNIQPLKKSAVMMSGSAAAIFLINMQSLLLHPYIDNGLIKWILLLALFGTAIPPLLLSNSIPRVSVGYSAIVMTVELPVAVICSQVVLNEQISPFQWSGIVLILLSIIGLNLKMLKGKGAARLRLSNEKYI